MTQVQTEGCKAKHLLADTWEANEEQEKILQPLQLYDRVSPFDSAQDSHMRASFLPVERMAEPRANEHETQLRQHIKFIRRVEQVRNPYTAILSGFR